MRRIGSKSGAALAAPFLLSASGFGFVIFFAMFFGMLWGSAASASDQLVRGAVLFAAGGAATAIPTRRRKENRLQAVMP